MKNVLRTGTGAYVDVGPPVKAGAAQPAATTGESTMRAARYVCGCRNCQENDKRAAVGAAAQPATQPVPAPPNLVDAIRAGRTTQPSQRLAAHFNKPRPVRAAAEHAAVTGSVPAAPSLIAAIKESRL